MDSSKIDSKHHMKKKEFLLVKTNIRPFSFLHVVLLEVVFATKTSKNDSL
jgi:hypothetical protein